MSYSVWVPLTLKVRSRSLGFRSRITAVPNLNKVARFHRLVQSTECRQKLLFVCQKYQNPKQCLPPLFYLMDETNLWQLTDRQLADMKTCFFTDSWLDTTSDRQNFFFLFLNSRTHSPTVTNPRKWMKKNCSVNHKVSFFIKADKKIPKNMSSRITLVFNHYLCIYIVTFCSFLVSCEKYRTFCLWVVVLMTSSCRSVGLSVNFFVSEFLSCDLSVGPLSCYRMKAGNFAVGLYKWIYLSIRGRSFNWQGATMVQRLACWPSIPRFTGSILHSSLLSHATINGGPVSVT